MTIFATKDEKTVSLSTDYGPSIRKILIIMETCEIAGQGIDVAAQEWD
jgi:hypothetical protein